MEERIPVTLIAGWHGSGKSSLIREIVEQPAGERLGVVVPSGTWPLPNALLVIQTEEEVVQRVDGCSSCAVRHDLRRCLLNLVRRRHRPERIVVELTGWADPVVAAQTLMGDPLLSGSVTLDGVVTVVDGASLMVRCASGKPLWVGGEQGEQVAVADLIVLSNTEKLTPPARERALRTVAEVNPRAQLRVGLKNLEYRDLVQLEAFTARAAGAVARLKSGGRSRLPSCSLSEVVEVSGCLDPERFDDWLNSLDHHASSRLLRVSGVVAIAGEDCRILCHRIGTQLCLCKGEPWAGHPCSTKLFVAGRDVPESVLSESLRDCAVA